MTSRQIAQCRLENQQIAHETPGTPEGLVRRMGCIQAQDFAGAKWALAGRIRGLSEADVDNAFQEGRILRTHVLRPTWHFVCPEDVAWMLRLSAPKIKSLSKGLHRKLGLDEPVLRRSKHVMARALAGGKRLTRIQLSAALTRAKINTDDIRLGFLLMDAELDGVICSGGREGKQFTYALFSDRVPHPVYLDKEASIGELASRYFATRGPATVYDFAWWSGLTISQAQRGLEMNRKRLDHAIVRGQAYWFRAGLEPGRRSRPSVYLLSSFDEYTVAYRDRADVLSPEAGQATAYGLKPVLLVNGQVAGTWKRTEGRKEVDLEVRPLAPLSKGTLQQLGAVAEKYARFVQKELTALDIA